MQETLQLGTYIIDLTEAMVEHGTQLHLTQQRQITQIHKQAVSFLTGYMSHERAPLDSLLLYLRQDAMMTIQSIIASAELLLSGLYGTLPPPYEEALREIQDCGYDMQADVIALQAELLQFIEHVGLDEIASAV